MRPAILGSALLALTATTAHAQLLEPATSSITTPDGQVVAVTTGFVRVPEVRNADGTTSGSIELAVVRLRRADSPARSNAHVILAGGPGDSGVNAVMGLARQGTQPVWQLFDGDVVGIDQRGTGRSRPNLDTPVRYELPLDAPGSIAEWLPRITEVSRRVAAEFRARGIRLEAYNTRESADDVEDVRRALGYERLTLWGRSYGSHLALATAARHPRMVDRLVLVSPEGLGHTWKLPSQVDAIIRRLTERGATNLDTHMRQALARLAAEPARVRVKHPQTGAETTVVLGAFDVQWITAQALGDPRLLATLAQAFREMAEGRFERLAQIALMRRSRAGVESAMKHMMDLSSGASTGRLEQIEREAPEAILGNAINFPGMFVANAWTPVTDLGPEFRRPLQSAIPTLILVGDLDPRTPVANAREIAATLSAARVVVLENATHQFDLFGSEAIRNVLAPFLRGEVVTTDKIVLPAIAFQ